MGQVPALVIDGYTLADSVSNWLYFVAGYAWSQELNNPTMNPIIV